MQTYHYLQDPGESRIKQWLDVSDSSGVVSKELQLSDQPVMGKWSIEVITSMVSFTVTMMKVKENPFPS